MSKVSCVRLEKLIVSIEEGLHVSEGRGVGAGRAQHYALATQPEIGPKEDSILMIDKEPSNALRSVSTNLRHARRDIHDDVRVLSQEPVDHLKIFR